MRNSEPCAQGGQANRHHPPKHRSCSGLVLFRPRSGLWKHGSGLAFPSPEPSGTRSPGSRQHPHPAAWSRKNRGRLPTSALPLGARLLPLRKRGGWAMHEPPGACGRPCAFTPADTSGPPRLGSAAPSARPRAQGLGSASVRPLPTRPASGSGFCPRPLPVVQHHARYKRPF